LAQNAIDDYTRAIFQVKTEYGIYRKWWGLSVEWGKITVYSKFGDWNSGCWLLVAGWCCKLQSNA
jgi:hypothetical protein